MTGRRGNARLIGVVAGLSDAMDLSLRPAAARAGYGRAETSPRA